MGSYLSIVNDTPDIWYCQVGDDQAAVAIFTIVTIALGAVATIVATAGAAAPLLSFAATNGVVAILGINTATALAIASAAAAASGTVGAVASAAGIVDIIVSQTAANIMKDGYQEILPNASHRYGKFSLTLWRQGHCRRLTKNLDPNNLGWIQEEVYMRPIFSGATDNSNLDHTIQFWIDKFGLENRQEFRIPPPDGRSSWGDVNNKLVLSVETVAPTSSPISSNITTMACNVCGNGFEVTMPEATVVIPGNGNFSCGFLDAAGKAGNITIEGCPFLTQFLAPCGCPVPPIPPDDAPWIQTNRTSQCVCPTLPLSMAPVASPNMDYIDVPVASPNMDYINVPVASPIMGYTYTPPQYEKEQDKYDNEEEEDDEEKEKNDNKDKKEDEEEEHDQNSHKQMSVRDGKSMMKCNGMSSKGGKSSNRNRDHHNSSERSSKEKRGRHHHDHSKSKRHLY